MSNHIVFKFVYSESSGEAKMKASEYYEQLPLVLRVDCLNDAIVDLQKEIEKQRQIRLKKYKSNN